MTNMIAVTKTLTNNIPITSEFSNWHPALKAIATLRKTLKVRTVFNLLGPLGTQI